MSHEKTFLEKCLAGDIDLDEIDDSIDEWHSGSSPKELYEFLGLTREEYALFVTDPASLPYIVSAHKFDVPLKDMYGVGKPMALAARGVPAEERKKIVEWLTSLQPK